MGIGILLTLVALGAQAVAERPEPIDPALASSRKAMLDLDRGWADPPGIARTRCWWWWLNGNVTEAAIRRDLAEMKAKGFGGANIIDAGGADQRGNLAVPHGPDFASPEWRALFLAALEEADRQGLELGFNILSGWNMGGPSVTPEQAAKKLTWSEMEIAGGAAVDVVLPQPPARDGFYRDVAVVAFPLAGQEPAEPAGRIAASSAQSTQPVELSADGDPATFWVSEGTQEKQGPAPERPQWLEVQFDRPVSADRVVVLGRPGYGPKACRLEVPDGPDAFRTLATFELVDGQAATATFPLTRCERFRLVMLDAFDSRFPASPRNVQVAEWSLQEGDALRMPRRDRTERIRDFEQKAYYRYPGAFTATEAWHLLQTDPETPGDAACRAEQVVDVSRFLTADGQLRWDAPPGRWKVLRFGYTITGAEVSTHSDGWAGLAIDYLDREPFEIYWRDIVAPILAEARPYCGRSLRYLHTDSWELGPVNWTPRMPEEFLQLRGYAMLPYLPVMANYIVENREVSTRFLNDLRRTLADLIARNNYLVFSEHAHALGLGIHPESGGPHAAPIDALMNLGIGDIPMGEFWARSETHRVHDYQRFFVKQTSSAAHVYGRRLSLAEAFTTIGPQWERDPQMLKPSFDRAACEGHNLTMWHTMDCSPAEMGLPGQAYFAGTHLNPQVTWWEQSRAFLGYLNRCQFLLQQGVPVSDVLHYYGENIPSFVRLKRDDPAGALPGYDYDVIDTTALVQRTQVDARGRIVLPDGTEYRLLSLTPHNAVSLPTLQHIARLVEQGATLVGPRPTRQYSLTGYPQSDVEMAALADRLWGPAGQEPGNPDEVAARSVGRGRVVAGGSARAVLLAAGVPCDFTWSGGDDQTLIDYVHRATDAAEIYFVANRNDRSETLDAAFRVTGRQPEIWDPVTGTQRDAAAFRQQGGCTIVPLEFTGEQSLFVVFRKPIAADAAGSGQRNFPAYRPAATLEGAWTVRFDPRWGGPESVTFEKLVDWTRREEEGIRYYSGTAIYEKSFDLPASLPAGQTPIVLDLGNLKNLAEVSLNGQNLGVVWSRPYRIDISAAVRPAGNRLVITVVNLWPNRLIGDARLPADQRRTRTNVTKFTADTPLLPSGLLGPVTLQTAE